MNSSPSEFNNQLEKKDFAPNSERINQYEQFINSGAELIKQQRFAEAIAHFRQPEAAERVGLKFDRFARQIFLSKPSDIPKTQNKIDSMANRIAMESWFKEGRLISPSNVLYVDKNGINHDNKLPPALLWEVALIHAEEWLHGLQELRKAPIAGHQKAEIDMAAYLLKKGVPLSAAFLRRYDRGSILLGNDFGDDSRFETPALRRGVFVQIQRTSGDIERDWQIINFNNKTGNVIAVNFSQGLKKEIPREELTRQNRWAILPFEKTQTYTELYDVLDRLGKIQGTQDLYTANEIKQLIYDVWARKISLAAIPRSGGLRQKVGKLTGTN